MGLLGSPLDDVEKIVRKWKPQDARTEAQCKKSLTKFLEENLEDSTVIKEYGKGRLRADIYVKYSPYLLKKFLKGDECFIELKYGFKSRTQLQRLIGQIHQYVDEKLLPCLIVLCGDCERHSVQELERFINSQNEKLEWEHDDKPLHILIPEK